MEKYKAMYTHLFHAVTQAIAVLQGGQLETEEMFISAQTENSKEEVAAKRLAFELLRETLKSDLTQAQSALLERTLEAQRALIAVDEEAR